MNLTGIYDILNQVLRELAETKKELNETKAQLMIPGKMIK